MNAQQLKEAVEEIRLKLNIHANAAVWSPDIEVALLKHGFIDELKGDMPRICFDGDYYSSLISGELGGWEVWPDNRMTHFRFKTKHGVVRIPSGYLPYNWEHYIPNFPYYLRPQLLLGEVIWALTHPDGDEHLARLRLERRQLECAYKALILGAANDIINNVTLMLFEESVSGEKLCNT